FLILDIVQPAAQTEQQKQAYEAFAAAFSNFKPRSS
ncbi:DNA-binding protein, partial [Pseudomonas aeruginosa]